MSDDIQGDETSSDTERRLRARIAQLESELAEARDLPQAEYIRADLIPWDEIEEMMPKVRPRLWAGYNLLRKIYALKREPAKERDDERTGKSRVAPVPERDGHGIDHAPDHGRV